MDHAAREEAAQANRREYGEAHETIRWITPEEADRAEEERVRLLEALRGRVEWGFGSTKADCRFLSPGCRCCGAGSWSCLFVNGICNARCFYCPSEQGEVGEPTTNTLAFPAPDEYAAYLGRFGFRGSSISGGEPLLTFDRTLRFLERIRSALGPEGHVWMYTNGILLSREKLERLAGTGLDEIRIDLTATDYDLGAVRLAAQRLSVTVEIPAIPEDGERLAGLLPELVAAGVRHLNLHELRCTPYNLPRLLRRGYLLRHGPRVTVAGSELAALRTLRAVLDRGIALPVNYCSSVYKSLWQARSARARAAEAVRASHESVTPAGYLRELWCRGPGLARIDAELRARLPDAAPWRFDPKTERLAFHPRAWPLVRTAAELYVRYHAASLRPGPSYQAAFREIGLGGDRRIVAERTPVGEAERIDAEALDRVLGSGGGVRYERLPEGLVPYF